MKECIERIVMVGFRRNPRQIFDEVEEVSAEMIRQGWELTDTCLEDGMAYIHLMFERNIYNVSDDNRTLQTEEPV